MEKLNRSSCVGVGKDLGRHSVAWNVYTWHSRENWSQKHRQISGKLSCFQVSGTHGPFLAPSDCARKPAVGWQPWQGPGRIARSKFKEEEGAVKTKVSKTNDPERSGLIRTRELEEEALRNDWTIETNRGAWGRRTAILRMDHTTGAAKIWKQTVWSDWHCLNRTQKIKVEASSNNSATEINQGGHRGKVGRIEVALGFVYHFTWKWLPVENCQR